MEIRITARHFELTDNLKNFAEDEVKRLEKYYDHIIDCHLTMSVEKSRQISELTASVYAKAFDMYVAIEQVITKMETQIKKYKAKLREKKTAKKASLKTQRIILPDLPEGESE
jgi:putative sigma-54 modulation protein